MAWIDVTKTLAFRSFSVGHTTPMMDLPQMSYGGFFAHWVTSFAKDREGYVSMKS